MSEYLTADGRRIKILSTPVEDYKREVRLIKTPGEARAFEKKFKIILDDAAECFERITEETFPEFIEQFPLCFGSGGIPDETWLRKYSAIPLPRLFIQIVGLLRPAGISSGLVLTRLIEAELAEIKGGRFLIKDF